jgi:hypothetical protein
VNLLLTWGAVRKFFKLVPKMQAWRKLYMASNHDYADTIPLGHERWAISKLCNNQVHLTLGHVCLCFCF